MWNTAETLVHRSSLIESQEDANRLLRTPIFQKIACPHCRLDFVSQRKPSLSHTDTKHTEFLNQQNISDISPAPPIPPPPPPPMITTTLPPQNSISHQSSPSPLPAHQLSSLPIPPPPPIVFQDSQRVSPTNKNITSCDKRSKTPEVAQTIKTLPQQETPTPRTKMKTINWNKIP